MSATEALIAELPGLDLPELQAWAARFGRGLAGALADAELPSFTLGLVGDLGAGKTTFAQALVAALEGGSGVRVTSPTYSIVHSYPTRPPVRHIDLYRIVEPEELTAIGYEELLEAPGINLVEWARSVRGGVPEAWAEIELGVGPDERRDLRLRSHGDGIAALMRARVLTG